MDNSSSEATLCLFKIRQFVSQYNSYGLKVLKGTKMLLVHYLLAKQATPVFNLSFRLPSRRGEDVVKEVDVGDRFF